MLCHLIFDKNGLDSKALIRLKLQIRLNLISTRFYNNINNDWIKRNLLFTCKRATVGHFLCWKFANLNLTSFKNATSQSGTDHFPRKARLFYTKFGERKSLHKLCISHYLVRYLYSVLVCQVINRLFLTFRIFWIRNPSNCVTIINQLQLESGLIHFVPLPKWRDVIWSRNCVALRSTRCDDVNL